MKSRPGWSLLGLKGGRDMGLTSWPGLVVHEAATWKRCRDLAWGWAEGRSRLAPTTWALCARPVHAESATYAGCARDMRATSRLCAQQRPRPGHCARSVLATWALGVRTVHPTQF